MRGNHSHYQRKCRVILCHSRDNNGCFTRKFPGHDILATVTEMYHQQTGGKRPGSGWEIAELNARCALSEHNVLRAVIAFAGTKQSTILLSQSGSLGPIRLFGKYLPETFSVVC